jgi:hypothetical protein
MVLVLCPDNMTPCLKAIFLTRRWLQRGAICTSSQAPFGAAAAIEHCPDVPFRSGVTAGAAQVQYSSLHFATTARRTMRISTMRQQHIMH